MTSASAPPARGRPAGATFPAGYSLPNDLADLLEECDLTTFQSSGPGGQHKNRTQNAVRLRHRPSGIVVIGKRERSQGQNRKAALERLRQRLEKMLARRPPRVATRPTRSARRERLERKRRRSVLKKARARLPVGEAGQPDDLG